jgi:hypothetical protein
MLGVSLSTLLTYLVEITVADQSRFVRGAAVFFVQLLSYGIVWVGRSSSWTGGSSASRATPPEHAAEVIGEIPI